MDIKLGGMDMNTEETITFSGVSEVDLENRIHDFLDEPGINDESIVYYKDNEGDYCADVVYTYMLPND